MSKYALEIKNLNYSYEKRQILNNINLKVKPGQIVSICGASGSGKSTLLKIILGTLPYKQGEVYTYEKRVTKPCRNVGMVYQNYFLYEFLTVIENVSLGLKLDQTNILYRLFCSFAWKKLQVKHKNLASEFIEKVGLKESRDCYPSELSGGMRQRVAIAQSLIMKPSVLLMDEPFGALDEATREGLQLMLLNLYQENIAAKKAGLPPPHTILIVTHELNEALYVSDRIIGLGKDVNGATVVYDQPSPVFRPNDPKDFSRFAKQKEEIRNIVFSQKNNERAEKLINAWSQDEENLPGGQERI